MKTQIKSTILALLYLASFAVLASFTSCEQADLQPTGKTEYRQAAHPPNWHHGNAMQSQDSALIMQTMYQFPPLPNDSIKYTSVLYNTGIVLYDTLNGYAIIQQTGNYTIEASCYRYFLGDSVDLQLSVNGLTVYSTGLLPDCPISFTTNVHLFASDTVYIRTGTWRGVETGGVLKISR